MTLEILFEEVALPNNISFLRFEDWHIQKEISATDWVVVARFQKDAATDFFTLSALASAAEGNLEKLLSTHEWEIDLGTFVKPFYYRNDSDEAAYYGPSLRTEVHGIELFPFIIDRYFQDYVPRMIELVQHFILYYNAFFIPEKCEYRCIDSNGNIQPVARMKQEQDDHIIWVDAHCLREYLTAIRCYLVRYHDHHRSIPIQESDGEPLATDAKSESLRNKHSHFRLTLFLARDENDHKIRSHLRGKDVVLPYSCLPIEEARFAHFITGRDEEGKVLELTCDESELNPPQFLTPVFFRKEVLSKYYQEPSRYKVSDSDVWCLSIWNLPISITEEELVHVWLGDLGRIPYEDQLHWRQFNISPRGNIPEHRIRNDLLAEFVSTDEPISTFRVAFEHVQDTAKSTYHEFFFLGLDKKDKHAYETLHVPLTDEEKELDEQVQALAKVTVDSINVDLLSRESGKKINENGIKGSIDLLGAYLNKIDIDEGHTLQILRAFHAVQSIRSTGSAHRKGTKFTKALKQFGLDALPNSGKAKKLILDLAKALGMIAEAMSRKMQA